MTAQQAGANSISPVSPTSAAPAAGIGRRLAKARRALGLTQGEVGARLGLSRVAVGYIEQGRRMPSLSTLLAMCELYGVGAGEACGELVSGRASGAEARSPRRRAERTDTTARESRA